MRHEAGDMRHAKQREERREKLEERREKSPWGSISSLGNRFFSVFSAMRKGRIKNGCAAAIYEVWGVFSAPFWLRFGALGLHLVPSGGSWGAFKAREPKFREKVAKKGSQKGTKREPRINIFEVRI